MIRKKRGVRALTVAAVSSATVLGGLFATVGGGAASAALSTSGSVAGSGGPVTLYPTGSSPTNVYPGATNQPATSWQFTLNNTFTQAESIVFNLGPTAASQCVSGTDYVAFAAVPTVTVKAGTTTSSDTAPSITATTAHQTTDGASCAGIKDQLVLTISNDATGDTTTPSTWKVTITGIDYSLGANTPAAPGGATPVNVTGTDTPGTTGSTAETLTVSPNANIQPVAVTSNTPPVGVKVGTSGGVSNITLKEFTPGQVDGGVPTGGPVVVTLPTGDLFTGTAKITATNSTVSKDGTAGSYASSATVTFPSAGSSTLTFYATQSTTPATFVISGLTVSVGTSATAGPQTATINYDNVTADEISTVVFSAIGNNRTAGYTADDTAAASLAKAFGSGTSESMDSNCSFNQISDYQAPSVVVTADFTPFDALSANYLASYLGTGVLITPENSLSNAAANAIRQDGVGCVYIVGGTLAVSQAVQQQLASTQAYYPGGVTPVTNPITSAPVNLNVVRIAGQTAPDTASDVAQYPGTNVPSVLPATPGAYGSYNDTTGHGSTTSPVASCAAPSVKSHVTGGNCVKTAILATDIVFQDALSSGPLSYSYELPVLTTDKDSLSSAAAAAIVNLGIQQVIIVGGPGAVSDAVATQVENLGASVLRIAGLTYSDTSVQLANFELNDQTSGATPVNNGLDDCETPGSVASSRGDFFADALTSAAATYEEPSGFCDFSPMLLTKDTSTVGPEVTSFLNSAGSTAGIGSNNVNLYSIDTYGGTLAQTPALVQDELNAIAAG